MKLATYVPNFIEKEVAEKHASRMDDNKVISRTDDTQVPNSWAWYGLHWDLLEDCCDKMSEITGIELIPTYDYCRIYKKDNILHRHADRPSCEVSVTINLKNVQVPWEFFWEGGSVLMNQGDAVIYRGCDVEHWREENPADFVYQSFLHYVDANGPYASHGNEYLTKKRK